MSDPGDEPLRVTDLSYAVRGKTIISGISFSMRRGEVRAVVGPNGAGKSTLARCVAGIAAASGGTVTLAGRKRSAMSRRQLARHVCYMPQMQGETPAFTVRDVVGMGRYAHASLWGGLDRGDAARIDEAMRIAEVDGLSDRLLPTLSGGERQMAAIAAGVAQGARLLVLDEPTTFLDPGHQDLLLRLVRRLNRERGISFLLVTHDVNLVMFFTHRVLALKGGRAVFDGESRDLARPGVLETIYGARFALSPIQGTDRRLAFAASLAEPEAWV